MIRTLRKSVLSVPLAAIALAVSSAYAAPVVGPSDDSFFTNPASLTGSHGDLIQYRTTTVNLGTGTTTPNKAWNVLYQSTDSLGAANAVSGTVIVPTAAWSGTGARPVILYAVGTQGLATNCAPSRQFATGSDYENANINAALKAGYAVLVTDYAGYLAGTSSTYLSGQSQGNAVLDIFKATTQIPSVGITASAPVGIWGFSQGGQSAAWAAETLATYAPGLNVKGVAAGGIPADFIAAAHFLDGNLGAAFLASGVAGLSAQYPTLNAAFNLLASADGKAQITKLKTECVFTALFDLQNKSLVDFTVDPTAYTLDDLLGVPAVNKVLVAQNLGKSALTVPMYQYHGQADEFIPLAQDIDLKRFYCSAPGAKVQFDLYPSEHIVTQFQAAPNALSWLADRFAGKTAPSSCSTNTTGYPTPTNTNTTPGGNFVVKLDAWPLTASVGLKTLGQTVNLPAASSFTAMTDITAKTLNGSLYVPDFKQSLKIIGIGSQIGMQVTPAGATTGSASLDNSGILHVHGNAYADITITSVSGIPVGSCKTVSPVAFPLNFDGPLSSLGNGGLNFSGTTTFPQVKGCFISGILTALMSGSGQTYSFTVQPPAPKSY